MKIKIAPSSIVQHFISQFVSLSPLQQVKWLGLAIGSQVVLGALQLAHYQEANIANGAEIREARAYVVVVQK